jgi:biopolymer transport protein TolQ
MISIQILPLGLFSGGVWQIVGETGLFGQIILITLLFFSLVSWGIIINKYRLFKKVELQNTIFMNAFRRGRKLTELTAQANSLRLSPLAGIFSTGYNELRDIAEASNNTGNSENSVFTLNENQMDAIEMTLDRAATEEISKLEKNVVFLATTANASPFLGLLGTVVGIMDAFWSIGERGSASLAVVAPGIAEALLVTIVGLGAAIPAVIGYNWASNRIKIFNDKSSNFALEFLTRLKKGTF